MTFPSFEFVAFFVALLLALLFCRGLAARNWLLLAASYAFYASWSLPCGLLLIGVTAVDYHAARKIHAAAGARRRRQWLTVSLVTNVGFLAFFKYSNFLLSNAGWAFRLAGVDTVGWRFDIILPVGISFFTFRSMSYTIDVYRRAVDPCASLRDYALFVSFFPQILAGPIARAKDLLPQIGRFERPAASDVEAGLLQFGLGAAKKLVIADQVAGHVALIFASPGQYDALTLLQGAVGYSVQIYCDFSGYSDMAIGAARIMGVRTAENFQMPYSATNITEFWRRWHISLSTWFRDYLFLPIAYALSRRLPEERYAGIRVDALVYVTGILATFALCGLWHGAAWTFVLWGLLHGVALAIHRAWRLWRPRGRSVRSGPITTARNLVAHTSTLGLVIVAWVLFRAESMQAASSYLWRLFTWAADGTRMPSPYIIPATVAVVAAHLAVGKDQDWVAGILQRPVAVRVLCYASLIFVVVSLGASEGAPFIYLQF